MSCPDLYVPAGPQESVYPALGLSFPVFEMEVGWASFRLGSRGHCGQVPGSLKHVLS